jgi:hypothetical protein
MRVILPPSAWPNWLGEESVDRPETPEDFADPLPGALTSQDAGYSPTS